jgi:phosphate transport system substrate-binding protein
MNSICYRLIFALAATQPLLESSAAEVRLNGASTTVNAVINPLKADVERAAGVTLKVVGSNTGMGLVALATGAADAAITSEPLEVSLAAAKFAGADLNAADYQLHAVDSTTVSWVVNPGNPVSELTESQVRDIFVGKIANWKEVGGPDLPIVVITDLVGAGTRTLIQFEILKKAEFGPKTRQLDNVRLIGAAVAELKGAFAGIGTNFVDPKQVKVVRSDRILSRPLGFITKGAPSTEIERIVAEFRAAVGRRK